MLLDINKLRVGMKIRICQNPRISIRNYGGDIAKLKMAGKVKSIHSITRKGYAITVKDSYGDNWTIHIDDVREIKSLHPIKPATFDPNQLVTK